MRVLIPHRLIQVAAISPAGPAPTMRISTFEYGAIVVGEGMFIQYVVTIIACSQIMNQLMYKTEQAYKILAVFKLEILIPFCKALSRVKSEQEIRAGRRERKLEEAATGILQLRKSRFSPTWSFRRQH